MVGITSSLRLVISLVVRGTPLCLSSKVNDRITQNSITLVGGRWASWRGDGIPLLAVGGFCGLPYGFTSAFTPHHSTLCFHSPAISAVSKLHPAVANRDVPASKVEQPSTDSETASATTATAPLSASDDLADDWNRLPITRLRTACRKLQLPSKGKRDDIVKRLKEKVPFHEVLAVIEASSGPQKVPQITGVTSRAPEVRGAVAARPTPNKCHICNSRTSARARFCSKCGATICAAGQETLREFVEKAFWPVREQEIGSNTMRVERGFWQSILEVIGDVPVSSLSAEVWEEYIRALKKRSCSPRTQVLHQVAYLAALKYAVHTRRLDGVHPFRKIRGCTKRTLVSVPLTAEEVYLLLAATPNTMHCALFAVGIGAGLRPSEILSMRWEDVNMEEMTATIRGSKTAASAAAIPLTDLAARELMRWCSISSPETS